MIVPLALLAAVALQPAASAAPALPGEPPEEMIDFLGRRQDCARRQRPRGPLRHDSAWLAYGCDRIAEEEAAYRARFAGDPAAVAWLDQDPDDFELQRVVVSTYDGPPPARILRSAQSGTDADGSAAYRLEVASTDGGRSYSVTLSFSDLPERTVRLDPQLFPWIDPQTLSVAVHAHGERRYLRASMRYGLARPWCNYLDEDDRARVTIYYFADRGVILHRGDRTNCRSTGEEIDGAPFLSPPR